MHWSARACTLPTAAHRHTCSPRPQRSAAQGRRLRGPRLLLKSPTSPSANPPGCPHADRCVLPPPAGVAVQVWRWRNKLVAISEHAQGHAPSRGYTGISRGTSELAELMCRCHWLLTWRSSGTPIMGGYWLECSYSELQGGGWIARGWTATGRLGQQQRCGSWRLCVQPAFYTGGYQAAEAAERMHCRWAAAPDHHFLHALRPLQLVIWEALALRSTTEGQPMSMHCRAIKHGLWTNAHAAFRCLGSVRASSPAVMLTVCASQLHFSLSLFSPG